MNRDSIDFGKDNITPLFCRILFPTLIAMICIGIMTMIDGIFVGRYIGSDALAAVNLFAPLWALMNGIGMMLGMGCSVVSSIHLAKGKKKAININLTQSMLFGFMISFLTALFINIFDEQTARFLGASDVLIPYLLLYQKWVSWGIIGILLGQISVLLIRLDGSPKYASVCSALPAIINAILDYVFLFHFHWGIEGIGIATCIGCLSGTLLSLLYFLFLYKDIHFYRLKVSLKSLMLFVRNIGYQIKIGFPAFLNDIGATLCVFVGNIIYMHYLKEDGVAAYSTISYITILFFMMATGIVDTAQPIISYNYGTGNKLRIKKAFRVTIFTSVIFGILSFLIVFLFKKPLVGLFLVPDCNAFAMAVKGLPLMSTCFIFFFLDVVLIGYFQSIKEVKKASILSFLKGIVFIPACFIIVPYLLGEIGLWTSVCFSDFLTFCACIWMYKKSTLNFPNEAVNSSNA
ncbi:MAG TPA: MATE family efflux transporter [Porphyromonadaceae bacterium]|nr:MATE family efflux transporter [Porphyromonadaceae bacterium]